WRFSRQARTFFPPTIPLTSVGRGRNFDGANGRRGSLVGAVRRGPVAPPPAPLWPQPCPVVAGAGTPPGAWSRTTPPSVPKERQAPRYLSSASRTPRHPSRWPPGGRAAEAGSPLSESDGGGVRRPQASPRLLPWWPKDTSPHDAPARTFTRAG